MSSAPMENSPPLDSERTEIRGAQVFAIPSREIESGESIERPEKIVHELVGQQLDHYRIESLVGIGGMGAVFRGRDLRLDRVVAIKVVLLSHHKAESLRRFRMEAQSAAKLDHPNIARVFYVGETDRWSYIVFEFIEGTNLRQLVLQRGPLSVDDATRWTCQVAEALQHASERGVVHRDIKPSNILIGLDGRAKIVDMGLARTTELDRSSGDLTASGVTLGTFDYISPEQAHDPRDADVRSDIYSLGCTLYFLLTAQPPFPDGTALQKLLMHGAKMPEDPRCFRGDISDALIAILRKMMAKRPKDRYQEPIDLVNDLRTLATVDSLEWRREHSDDINQPIRSGRSWWEFAVPALTCLACIGLVTLWLHNDNQRSGVYVIPRVEVQEIASIENANSVGRPEADISKEVPRDDAPSVVPELKSEPAGIESSALATSSSEIVISEPGTSVSGVQRPYESVRSLEEALARWESNHAIERIVIATPSIKVLKPISLGRNHHGRTLRLQGTDTVRPLIAFGDAGNRLSSEAVAAWFVLDSASVEIRGVDFDASHQLGDGTPPSLVQITSGAHLAILDSTITFKSAASGRLPSFFSVKNFSSQPSAPCAIQLERTAIRGQGDLIRIESNERVDIQMQQVWAAVAGSMIEVEGGKTLSRSPRVRAELNQVTSISLKPWLRLRMGTANPYPVAFVRIANNSIFSGSQTLVEWDAANVVDWPFAEQANRVDDLGRWIDLRGMDNLYDVPTILRLLQVIMSMSSEEVAIDSDSNLLRNERGMELLAAWKTAPALENSRIHTMTPGLSDTGNSTLRTGCSHEQLPAFPPKSFSKNSSDSFGLAP